jgi:putative hydrolase of the HAD superfamily
MVGFAALHPPYWRNWKGNMKYKAVVFDLFGTLVNNFTTSEYLRVLVDMSAFLGAPADKFIQLWRDTFNLRTNGAHKTHQESIRYICNELGVPVKEEQVEKAAAIRVDYTIKTLIPRPDTLPTINSLKSSGYKVALISDCSPETPAAWPQTPFHGVFHVAIFSCTAGVKKPNPRIYHMACDHLGIKAADCLYVGDGSSHELTGAQDVGMHPVQILDPKENADTHFIEREENWTGPKISYLKEVLDFV